MDKREREAAASIAAEVRRARKERGWSQLELAERADLSLNYVSLIERAERLPSIEVLIQLASVLGTTLVRFLGASVEEDDPWLTEATAILRALPLEARGIVRGVLRGALDAANTPKPKVVAAPRKWRRKK